MSRSRNSCVCLVTIMPGIEERPVYTEAFDALGDFVPDAGSLYLSGKSVEERSEHPSDWETGQTRVRFCNIVGQAFDQIAMQGAGLGAGAAVVLRSMRALLDWWAGVHEDVVYLDYTGLSHHVWAPLLRSALAAGKTVRAVYVEPKEYRRSDTPREGEIFDLSERIGGVAPLPGFASLNPDTDDAILIALLGFEGSRFAHIVELVQPPGDRIIPIIGVPGFRPEYPFHTYLGNQPALEQTKAWRHVRYARANCPFSAFYALTDVGSQWPNGALKIAPIGTKPHALGAVLFYLVSGRDIELIYDHPVRKERRTAGSGRVNIYHVSALGIEPSRAAGNPRNR